MRHKYQIFISNDHQKTLFCEWLIQFQDSELFYVFLKSFNAEILNSLESIADVNMWLMYILGPLFRQR